jgi:hypothetical protein
MRRRPAILATAALLTAAVLVGSFGGGAHSHRFQAGQGPVATHQRAAQPSWWICAAATQARGPC